MHGILTMVPLRVMFSAVTGTYSTYHCEPYLTAISSEDIMALEAPHTNKCDMCRTLFCGLAVPSRCIATALLAQHPFGFAEVSDLLQSPELYDAFHSNEYEVELLLAYLTREDIIPRDIYRDTVSSIINSSKGFAPLFEDGLFGEPGDIDVNAPRNKICRSCAADVLIWGIRAWWVRERRGALSADLLARPDCPDGRRCNRQEDLAHAKECENGLLPDDHAIAYAFMQSITSSKFPRQLSDLRPLCQ